MTVDEYVAICRVLEVPLEKFLNDEFLPPSDELAVLSKDVEQEPIPAFSGGLE